jgi:CubicO group peptidase (beta-lactamase class C family)
VERRNRSIAIFSLLLFVFAAGAPVTAQAGRFDLEKTKTVLSGMIEKAIQTRGVPSISIALVKGDAIVWKAAFGHANVRTRTPATPETIYSTGSTFKAVTSAAIMQLVEQGKLKLDDPVNRHLGDVQVMDRLQTEKPVTIRHILSHWSGLNAGAITKPLWGRELPKSLGAMVAGLYSVRPVETRWEYNNFAYGMAGLIVEKASGKSYEQYVVDQILKPLGVAIEHPVQPNAAMVELMALPYMPGGASGKPTPVDQVHYDVYPAGDIYLTAEDMARFLGAQLNDGVFNGQRILSAESVAKMREPQFGGTYGFGLFLKTDDKGHRIISHSGGIPGQSSFMSGDVDAKVGVYYMSNSGAPGEIAEAALALLRGEDYVPVADRKFIAVEPKVLDTYVGEYELTAEFVFSVTREGGKLLLQQGAAPTKVELLATAPGKFRDAGWHRSHFPEERRRRGRHPDPRLERADHAVPEAAGGGGRWWRGQALKSVEVPGRPIPVLRPPRRRPCGARRPSLEEPACASSQRSRS